MGKTYRNDSDSFERRKKKDKLTKFKNKSDKSKKNKRFETVEHEE